MSDADVVYYNLSIGNNNFETAGNGSYKELDAKIDADNNIPILHNPDDYYGCIIRFQLPMITTPLISFLVETPVNDINKGIYTFTICKGWNIQTINELLTTEPTQTSTPVNLTFQPQVLRPPIYNPPVGTPTQTISDYYLLYDYEWFIAMMNRALQQAHRQLYPVVEGEENTQPPFFKYDAPSQLITLYSPSQYDTDNCYICFNNSLLQYFLGLTTISLNQGNNLANGRDNVITPVYGSLDKVKINIGGYDEEYYKTSYQYSSYAYWNWLKSVLITTTMNVNSEAFFINNNSNNQNVNFQNILEDFMPDLAQSASAGVQNSIFTYDAPSLYRIWSFNQKTPLYRVNLGISLVDTYNNQYPLLLPKGQSANFKIMFIKKSVYSGIKYMKI